MLPLRAPAVICIPLFFVSTAHALVGTLLSSRLKSVSNNRIIETSRFKVVGRSISGEGRTQTITLWKCSSELYMNVSSIERLDKGGGTKEKLWGHVFSQISGVIISNARFSSTRGPVGGSYREMYLRCLSTKRVFYFAFI